MFKFKKLKISIGIACLALASIIAPANATNVDFSNPAFVAPLGETSIPVGHMQFCETNPGECKMNSGVQDAVSLNQNNWNQLIQVNAQFNESISPVTDLNLYKTEEFWTYPKGYGDCEDYVLAKRKQLIDFGWPASTLLITVVRQTNGEGHAVLLVRTDRGDLVLDNQDGLVKLWNQTPYQFLKRQSQNHSGRWVDLFDPRPIQQLASL